MKFEIDPNGKSLLNALMILELQAANIVYKT
jgi:hypothetical protein